MKVLDLNAMGVRAMTHSEMVAVDGGCGICDAIIAVAEAICDLIHAIRNN
jgi:hypothetical protein